MKKLKPVMTLRFGSHLPTVKLGMETKPTHFHAEYMNEFRRKLRDNRKKEARA